jgi:hypothetical protein
MSYSNKDTLQGLLVVGAVLLVICMVSKSKKRKDKKIVVVVPPVETQQPDTIAAKTAPADTEVKTVHVEVQQPPSLVTVPVVSESGSTKEVTVSVQQPPKVVPVQIQSPPLTHLKRKGVNLAMLPGMRFRENASNPSHLSGLRFKKENMYVASKKELNATGYTRSTVENFDDGTVQSLNNLETGRTPVLKLPKKLLNNHDALRRTDANIPIDYLNQTFEDVLFEREGYGFDIMDSTKARSRLNEKARGSLSVDLLQLTDNKNLAPEYGQMYGEVTMG